MEVLWIGLAMEQSRCCELLVSEFPKVATTQWSYSLQKATPRNLCVCVQVCVHVRTQNT